MLKVVKGTTETAPPVETPVVSTMDRAVAPRSRRLIYAAAAGGILLIAAAGGLAYQRFGGSGSATVSAERLSLSEVRQDLFRDFAPVTGSVTPRDTIYLDSPEGGQVVGVLVEEGARVRAGQPLVRLANTRLELEVIGREAQFNEQRNTLASLQLALTQNALEHRRAVEDADYQVARAQADIARFKPLAEKGFYPKASLEDRERELAYYQNLRATRLEAQAADRARLDQQLAEFRSSSDRLNSSVSLVRDSLANLTVTAPIDGQVTVLSAKPGQAIAPGQRIGQVDRTDGYKVRAPFDEFYLGRVAPGQRATATVAGKAYQFVVARVYPEVRDRRFQADLDFVGAAPADVRPGQTVQLRLELGAPAQALIVDNGVFYEDSGGTYVFVVSPDGSSAQRREVRLGRRNPEAVEVVSGLKAGERIITSSYQTYRNIDRINLVGSKPAPK